uniref:Uncharacterized protein n=1 Tax=Arundo donax TaxID=35708 RepID=A0A0A9A860_ARUDO
MKNKGMFGSARDNSSTAWLD